MDYDYSYSYGGSEGGNGFTTFLYIAVFVLSIVCYWKLFQKAGQPGWKSIVPVYNVYTMTKLLFSSGWFCLLMFVPVANIVFTCIYSVRMAKAYGKGTGFGIGLIFLSVIFLPILAFSSNTYYVGNPALGGANNMGGYPQQNNGYGMPNNNYDPNNYYGQNNNYNQNNNGF